MYYLQRFTIPIALFATFSILFFPGMHYGVLAVPVFNIGSTGDWGV